MNRLFGSYMLIAAVPLLFPYHPAYWPLLILIHLIIAFVAFRPGVLAPLARIAPPLSEIFADWYPLALMPWLYLELATLNASIFNGRYFDALIQGWERTLFGGQPSHELAALHPSLWLSELLHASYLSYYFIIFAPPLILYLQGRRSEQRRTVFTVMLAFFVHYLFFMFFPVQGPRYLFAAPGGVIAQGKVYQLAHRVLEAGSSRGAAFPSSHVGVSVAQTIMTIKYLPRLAPLFIVLAIGLTVGAVYAGFHYATDAITGLILGAVVAVAAPRVQRLIAPASSAALKNTVIAP